MVANVAFVTRLSTADDVLTPHVYHRRTSVELDDANLEIAIYPPKRLQTVSNRVRPALTCAVSTVCISSRSHLSNIPTCVRARQDDAFGIVPQGSMGAKFDLQQVPGKCGTSDVYGNNLSAPLSLLNCQWHRAEHTCKV